MALVPKLNDPATETARRLTGVSVLTGWVHVPFSRITSPLIVRLEKDHVGVNGLENNRT